MISLIEEYGLKEVLKNRYKEIQKLYKSDKLPWVIGYSGGKDSTATLQLIINSLSELPNEELNKKVFVVSSDTLVENPLILQYLEKNIDLINKYGKKNRLPIEAHILQPEVEESFWTLMLGKGYPTPRQKFRWCTDRLKIKPIDKFIKSKIDKYGKAIVILGTRRDESASRAQVMEEHSIDGKLLKRHTSLNNAYVYSPIEYFTTDDVWGYLLNEKNPWGGNNRDLFTLYAESRDAKECPMQTSKENKAPSCGQSRFGCWTCTVVVKDKSLTGFINTGHKELKPLLYFRNMIKDMRNKEEYRQKRRTNGSIYYINTNDGKRRGYGPFNMKARRKMLKKLLTIQKKSKFNLIKDEELRMIRKLWIEEGDWQDKLPEIYEEVYGKEFQLEYNERPVLRSDEIETLKEVCEEVGIAYNAIQKLISLENEYYGYQSRKGVYNKINTILKQDWLHEDHIDFKKGV